MCYDGCRVLPVDYRVYHPDRPDTAGAKWTKNGHFADLLEAARARGLKPRCVPFDGWYASPANPKLAHELGSAVLTRLRGNRVVRVDHGDARAVPDQVIGASGTAVWLPGYGEL